jgi:hypothetical protein
VHAATVVQKPLVPPGYVALKPSEPVFSSSPFLCQSVIIVETEFLQAKQVVLGS